MSGNQQTWSLRLYAAMFPLLLIPNVQGPTKCIGLWVLCWNCKVHLTHPIINITGSKSPKTSMRCATSVAFAVIVNCSIFTGDLKQGCSAPITVPCLSHVHFRTVQCIQLSEQGRRNFERTLQISTQTKDSRKCGNNLKMKISNVTGGR